MKNSALKFITPAIAAACLGLLPNHASAQSQYFTTVANNGTYSWDGANWNASGSTANSGPYTSTWTSGDFARFYNGASDNYTVTVNASEANTGIYNDASGSTLNIDGTGNLDVITAIQGFLSASGTTTYINVPITGNGGIAPESTGNIYLMAANTYTAGTALGDSGNTLTYFNNNNAFSSGGITLNRTGNFSTLGGVGGAALTVANNFSTVVANTGSLTELNFANALNTPVTYTGTWTLGTVNVNLRSSGGSTAPVTLSGPISGTGNLIFSANTGSDSTSSKTVVSGANTFSGTVTVTGSGGTYGGNVAATLQLGAVNTLATSTGITLAGGMLSPGGFSQVMDSAGLTLSGSSTIDFALGGSLHFANSSGLTWSGILDLTDWTTADNGAGLEFGTSASGLTAAQLADIEIDGVADAGIDANGYIYMVVPEPSSLALAFVGGLGLCLLRRRKV